MIRLSLILIIVFTLSGCFYGPYVHSGYDIQKANIHTKYEARKCGWYILFLIGPFNDLSIKKAAEEKFMNKIEIVEYDDLYLFPLAWRHCVNVYGN